MCGMRGKINFKGNRYNFCVLVFGRPRSIPWRIFSTFKEIQKKTVKMRLFLYLLDDEMISKIMGSLETGSLTGRILEISVECTSPCSVYETV